MNHASSSSVHQVNLLIVLSMLATVLSSCSVKIMDEVKAKDQLNKYLQAVNNHEIDKALSFLSDDFVLEMPGGYLVKKIHVSDYYYFDKGANASYKFINIVYSNNVIFAEVMETNQIMKNLGLGTFRAKAEYHFDHDGTITKLIYQPVSNYVTLSNRIREVAIWARTLDPHLLEEIYPNNQISLTEKSAKKWVELTDRWKHEK